MAKNSLVAAIDGLPWIVKIILCLPGINIVYAIYRIIKGATQNDTTMLIVGIIWIFAGSTILWIVDLATTLFGAEKRPTICA